MCTPSFFDTTPYEVLNLVLEYLSEEPHTREWEEAVASYDIFAVENCGSALEVAGRQIFKRTRQESYRNVCDHFSIVSNGRRELERLTVFDSGLLGDCRFPALRALTLKKVFKRDAMQTLFKSCGHQLRELALAPYQPLEHDDAEDDLNGLIDIIAHHCKSVEVLHLSCDSLPVFDFQAAYESFGHCLRELHVSLKRGHFAHIAKHCSALEILYVDNIGEIVEWLHGGDTSIAFTGLRHFHYKFESRLQLQIGEFAALLKVLPPTTNIHFICGRYTQLLLEYMKTFDSRLRTLEVHHLTFPFPDSARDSLLDLKSLMLNMCESQAPVVQSFFNKPFRSLRHLDISLKEDVLPSLIRTVSTLHDFRFSMSWELRMDGKAPFNVSDFAHFLQLNTELRCLDWGNTMFEPMTRMTVINETADLVRGLKQLQYLKEARITFDHARWGAGRLDELMYREIEDASNCLRTKPMFLQYNEVRLLPR